MALIVQKFGGTSVGSVDRIKAVAQRVQATVAEGHSVVVVVSAMGKTTDTLVALADEITDNPSRREMDMLLSTGEQVSIALVSMALQELGQPAVSMTGAQIGISTEAAHSRARILKIKTERLKRCLDGGNVVVAAGFQGISSGDDSINEFEITTLGRGGSDTSAVALAVALGGDRCEIYTDVPGILSTDPRIVPEAQLMAAVTSDEMLELASLGASVLHPRAVEIARNYGMSLVVRSSWTDDPGTWVRSAAVGNRSLENLEISRAVDAIRYDIHQAQVNLLHVPDRPGIAAQIFGELANAGVSVDQIVQSIHAGNTNDIAFTVREPTADQTQVLTESLAAALQPKGNDGCVVWSADRSVAEVSICGAGMIGRPGVAAKMFATLAAAGVNIEIISTSEVQVGCIIGPTSGETDLQELCDRAVAALKKAFDLKDPAQDTPPLLEDDPNLAPVCGVALDAKQSQIAIRQVPDRPGMAAQVFEKLAEDGISVDMIIQSQRRETKDGVPTRDIAFTLAESDVDTATQRLRGMATEEGWGAIAVSREIAKVSIVGMGMAARPGVAAQMFQALADRGINIHTITTSAIKVSCVIGRDRSKEAVKAIHDKFGLEQPPGGAAPTNT
ncbi:MAG: aspartate kinase [Cyanobacteria bacterium P01_C01_bin.89]